MSRLAHRNGDDHPEAAGKHLADAGVLKKARRHDGAGYLAGYVVECCLKAIVQLETGQALRGHDLCSLRHRVDRASAMVGSRTARYVSTTAMRNLAKASIMAWHPGLRYRAPGSVTSGDAKTWVMEARAVYNATVVALRLDGVI